MPEKFYPDRIYPFQDKILQVVETANLDFYLTGGTALGRCYLGHRYSDDLDFFVNDHKEFKKQCAFVVDILKKKWECNIETTSSSFVRIFVIDENTSLKVDFVNDIPIHHGTFKQFAIFHRVDNWRNILSNKICALSRLEAKDMADILFIAYQYDFEWEDIIEEAREKDLWVEPLEVCGLINSFPPRLMQKINWIIDVDFKKINKNIQVLHDDIFMGRSNSLYTINISR